eukprot:gene10276-2695_t
MFRSVIKSSKFLKNYTVEVKPKKPIKLYPANMVNKLTTDELFGPHERVVVFGIPGAFTPVCQTKHLPNVLENAHKYKKSGVDKIVCISVNDPAVMKAFGEKLQATNDILFVADPYAEFTKSIECDVDLSSAGLGTRSQRYSMIVDDGKLVQLNKEDSPGNFTVTTSESTLKEIEKLL